MGEKFEDLIAKICRFVISDIIKTGLSAVRHDVTRAAGTDNVDDCLSCDDFLYSECNLEIYDSGYGVDSESGDEEYGGGNTDELGKEPYQFKPTGTDFATLCPAPTSAQDSLDPLQLALVLIFSWPHCICTHTNGMLCVVVVVCGGDCM